jgi:glycine cleavage system H lipoate-binding protein
VASAVQVTAPVVGEMFEMNEPAPHGPPLVSGWYTPVCRWLPAATVPEEVPNATESSGFPETQSLLRPAPA